ncbi:hypothetical protein B0J11DRAFT_435078 [Dendryphion nanum]|uniref:Uncharacterized protein n=1 Tax=Dendryphion nanum TaxID=256645 RepID=A0A9P9IM43_9PLEO|nr:hypothetical protein B0J11DRAFT_435078 [Dendryphion nanum]
MKKARATKNDKTEITLHESPRKRTSALKKKKPADGELLITEEKRLRRFRKHAPQSYIEIKQRALTQRLTVMGRERIGTDDIPEENVSIAGSTGNLYTVHIGLVPSCDCPHAKKGNQCKHIIYVMLRVLKAREETAYQLALLSPELRDLLAHAPAIPVADPDSEFTDGNRKPIEGECPICYTEFDPATEAIVYCKASCGNNVHKECMQNWAKASRGMATCPMCRSAWPSQEFASSKVDMQTAKTEEGYVNVASQLGLSGERDYSSYHEPWVRQQFGSGTSRRRRRW